MRIVEEVDFATGRSPGRGDNFGWNFGGNCREGAHPGPGEASEVCAETERAGTFTEPVFEYPRNSYKGSSITGGYVVRDRGPS
jgi:hypothetical protein